MQEINHAFISYSFTVVSLCHLQILGYNIVIEFVCIDFFSFSITSLIWNYCKEIYEHAKAFLIRIAKLLSKKLYPNCCQQCMSIFQGSSASMRHYHLSISQLAFLLIFNFLLLESTQSPNESSERTGLSVN